MVDTIARMIHHYSETAEEYVRVIRPPCIGYKWGCDEKKQ